MKVILKVAVIGAGCVGMKFRHMYILRLVGMFYFWISKHMPSRLNFIFIKANELKFTD